MSKPTWEKENSHRLPSVLLPGFIKDTEPLRTENSKATWRKCIKARIPELPGKDLECETHPDRTALKPTSPIWITPHVLATK